MKSDRDRGPQKGAAQWLQIVAIKKAAMGKPIPALVILSQIPVN